MTVNATMSKVPHMFSTYTPESQIAVRFTIRLLLFELRTCTFIYVVQLVPQLTCRY